MSKVHIAMPVEEKEAMQRGFDKARAAIRYAVTMTGVLLIGQQIVLIVAALFWMEMPAINVILIIIIAVVAYAAIIYCLGVAYQHKHPAIFILFLNELEKDGASVSKELAP